MPTDDLNTVDDRADACDCAPSTRERRAVWGPMSRRAALGAGILGVAALAAAATAAPLRAWADSYPSWDDVQRAMANQTAKSAEIARIQGLIQGLQADVAAKQAAATQAGDAFYKAQQDYFDAADRADALQQQADAQAQKATEAAQHAGRVASQLYRDGGDDTTMQLFLSGSAASADTILSKLGTMDKLLERNQDVYADAVTARDSAKSLSDQAKRARDERDRLQQIAQDKMAAAQAASDAAQAALDAQSQHLDDLNSQLAALQNATATTLAGYKAGVEARRQAEIARQAAEAKAREEAAAAAHTGGGGGGSPAGVSNGSGWCRPNTGPQTSGYGPRVSQCGRQGCASSFHRGVDLAASCGAPIFAAHSGTVDYAGDNGGYGNYIRIQHGGGIGTGYGHMRRLYVRPGQSVSVGQVIGEEGNTGASFGCHLHFEVYVNGGTVNPVPFMAARGISV